ncbi:kinase-like domain-containing protein [Suillus subalutaceus]|uniref:kinase-like domain-containing protein n=1 Tax=Suillus subalutaceus TaxID=48586 RepID=UPI001B86699B|nr:kinase-like domain-containing protein [Suillus subalutaceus]KAG1837923.1 kinase-like domain-containing protein [Suillus subalutaceus]
MPRELLVWLRLKHSTIVPLLGTAKVESPFPALISQWMSSGTLYMYLEQVNATDSTRIKLNIIHGDLHPACTANVLIDDSGNPRLTDFGLATVAGDAELQLSMTTATRTLDSRWRAPEIVGIERDPEKPSFKSDIYALGGVMFFVRSWYHLGDVPWKEKSSVQICIALSQKVEHLRPDNILDYHWTSIQKCWSWDPGNRPDAAEVIEYITPKNIIIFGERGAGKSSVINLLAGRQVAETSSDQNSLTLHYDAYGITIDDVPYRVYDTTGFDDYRTNPSGFLYAITNAHKLAKELREKGGVYLLLYCIKGDEIPSTFITNYRLLYEFLFEEKVPVALIATHLEGEDNMDDWHAHNKEWFDRQAVKYVDHACITAADNPDPKCREKYEMSRTEVGKLISRQAQHWNRGDWSYARIVGADDPSTWQASKADVLGVLTMRCGLGESLAKVVIRNLYTNMTQRYIFSR